VVSYHYAYRLSGYWCYRATLLPYRASSSQKLPMFNAVLSLLGGALIIEGLLVFQLNVSILRRVIYLVGTF
jgi:hypothetical protein